MKIAVPTNDGASMAEHFGRSAAFLVFEIENNEIRGCEPRTNAGRHLHEQGACAGGGRHEPHSHAGILAALEGCSAVICAGMGARAAEALQSAGIAAVVTGGPGSAEDAVKAYLRGELRAGQGFCRCSH